jgi:hypothetical protein
LLVLNSLLLLLHCIQSMDPLSYTWGHPRSCARFTALTSGPTHVLVSHDNKSRHIHLPLEETQLLAHSLFSELVKVCFKTSKFASMKYLRHFKKNPVFIEMQYIFHIFSCYIYFFSNYFWFIFERKTMR